MLCNRSIEGTINISVKRDLNLRHATRCTRFTYLWVRSSPTVPTLGRASFPFSYLDAHMQLVVRDGDGGLSAGNNRVVLPIDSPDSTGSSIPNERARPPRPRNPQRFLACLKLSNKKRKVSKTSRVQREIVQQKPVKSR